MSRIHKQLLIAPNLTIDADIDVDPDPDPDPADGVAGQAEQSGRHTDAAGDRDRR